MTPSVVHPPAAHPERSRAVAFAGRLAFLLAFWIFASRAVVSYSERFYLMVPGLFATEALWMRCRGDIRSARRRLVLSAAGAAVIFAVLALDCVAPSQTLQPFERSIVVFAASAVLIVAGLLLRVVRELIERLLNVGPDSRIGRRIASRALTLGLFALLLTAYLLSFLETHWPKRLSENDPGRLHLSFERVTWQSRDGTRLAGWLIPAENATCTAVVCHGVGADKSDMLEFVYALHTDGFNVLALDFRGHGESGGHTVTYGAQEQWDIVTALDMMEHRFPDLCANFVGIGWSMGAASLILAAANDERLAALHLDAAYARTFDMARVIAAPFPPVFAQAGLYLGTAVGCLESGTNLFALAPVDAIAQVAPRPIMLVHGEADRLIPIAQGRLLFAAAGEPKEWHVVPGAGHCETLAAQSPCYEARMCRFLHAAIAAPSARGAARQTDGADH